MAGAGLWASIKSLLGKSEDPLFLNDSSAFDFSDEVGDEDFPRFNKLRVVVADDGSEAAPETPVNGASPGLPSDDESLLDRDIALRSARAGRPDPCSGCSSRRERSKQRKVKKRLTLAALLYLLFMTGELIGGYVANSLAIMTDALHMLTDLSGIILTLLALWLSAKSPTKRFTFGFHRLGAASHFCNNCSSFSAPSASRLWSGTGCGVEIHETHLEAALSNEPTVADPPLSRTTISRGSFSLQPSCMSSSSAALWMSRRAWGWAEVSLLQEGRGKVLSAIISVLLVYILMAFLLYEAVQRTIHMDYEINGDIMLITAAVGVAVNLIMGFLLNQSGHLHSHSHSHPHSHAPQPSSPSAAQGSSHGHSSHGHSSLAVRAAFVHALGDLVQSIGVLVAAYIIRFKPEYKIADPICTYVFSILVVFTTIRILCDTGVIILEDFDPRVQPKQLLRVRSRSEVANKSTSLQRIKCWLLPKCGFWTGQIPLRQLCNSCTTSVSILDLTGPFPIIFC
ncbi:probable proton-coupled zinc antiporter SLC30A4 isoform X2 [Serinus canaria]|uniref:probable proton-coupled zinc antiporter SLC30A4 isoform X2 n=1 Tax=Serinus canaria TaxID=9135 RepID=UPI0021CCD727|nr:probable proton-coupled zinc antiporter SLC30A4 isoform X2 [Serinus canaria]